MSTTDSRASAVAAVPARLRPAKVSSALRRRWFERRLNSVPVEPLPGLEHVGTRYGGWWIPLQAIDASWTCWCVGAGGDTSFEVELLARRARVRTFEPVAEFVDAAQAQCASFERFSAHEVAIAHKDGPLHLQRTHVRRSRSVSSAGLYDTNDWYLADGRTISSLKQELGDERIDLLKLDIEGGEYGVVPALDLRKLGTDVLCVQLHHNGSVGQARSLIAGVREQGFDIVRTGRSVKMTFVNRVGLATRAARDD